MKKFFGDIFKNHRFFHFFIDTTKVSVSVAFLTPDIVTEILLSILSLAIKIT